MNTPQNYGAGPNNAQNSTPAVNSGPQTITSAEQRVANARLMVDQVQKQLLDLFDNCANTGVQDDPVVLLTDLLYMWLTSPVCDLTESVNKRQLAVGFELIRVMSQARIHLYELEDALYSLKAAESEVSNG